MVMHPFKANAKWEGFCVNKLKENNGTKYLHTSTGHLMVWTDRKVIIYIIIAKYNVIIEMALLSKVK